MFTVLMFGIGVFIGWNLPMPEMAKNFQEKVLGWFKSKTV